MPSLKIAAVAFFFLVGFANAQPFYKVGDGTDYYITGLYADSSLNGLFAVGRFNYAGNIHCNHVAKWNGIVWDSLNTQLLPYPERFTKFNNDYYITDAAWYDSTGTLNIARIGKWDSLNSAWVNTAWIDPWVNPTYGVENIEVYGNQLYATGLFDSIGGVYANLIGRFDGNNWYSYPPIDTVPGWRLVCSIIYNGNLYVGGNFYSTVVANTNSIARFNGTQWQPLGTAFTGGASTWVNDLEIYQGKLIVIGYFTIAGGGPGNCIAAWDGNSWSQVGNSFIVSGQPRVLQIYNNELWVGGGFYVGNKVVHLAKFNGVQWDTLNVTLDNVVTSMAVLGNDLYIGGGFWTANGDSVNHIIRYNPQTGFQPLTSNISDFTISPNPANNSLTIQLQNLKEAWVHITDVTGRIIYEVFFYGQQYTIDLKNIPFGIYFATIKSKAFKGTKKLIVSK